MNNRIFENFNVENVGTKSLRCHVFDWIDECFLAMLHFFKIKERGLKLKIDTLEFFFQLQCRGNMN